MVVSISTSNFWNEARIFLFFFLVEALKIRPFSNSAHIVAFLGTFVLTVDSRLETNGWCEAHSDAVESA